jgi:tetratricopeptide (TPR) repeat protein
MNDHTEPGRRPPRYRALFAKLKRRHVFKVAMVYGATAFLVLAAVELVYEVVDLPAALITILTAFAFLGFPLAVAFAWRFEITADGVRRIPPPAEGEIEAIASASRRERWPAGFLALAGLFLLVGGVGGAWLARKQASSNPAETSAEASGPSNLEAPGTVQLFNAGLMASLHGRNGDAIQAFTAALEIERRPEILDARSRAYLEVDRNDEAVSDAEEAVALEPDNPAYLNNRAWAYREVGRDADALADLNRALSLDPGLEDARLNRATLLRTMERHEEAVADFTYIIEARPENAAGYFNRASALQAAGRTEKAVADLERFIELTGNARLEARARERIARWEGQE